jgi:hypothetical protein
MISRSLWKTAASVRRAILFAVVALCSLSATLLAQFAAEDEVRLRRDEPLRFKGGIFREGKAGDTFKVVRYDPAAGYVYLLAFGSDGKSFALQCADVALEPMPKDYWALVQAGVRTAQQGDMVGARAIFVRAATGEVVDKTAIGLALQCEALDKAAGDLVVARATASKNAAEIARLLRNAQVADRPSLIPGDTSNQVRAEEMRTKATVLKEQAEKSVLGAEDALVQAMTSASSFSQSLIASGSLSIGLPMSDAFAAFARKTLPPDRQPATGAPLNRAELNTRINAATDALAKARVCMQSGQLRAAIAATDAGLSAESGRGDLKQLRTEAESRLTRVRTLVALATSLKQQERTADALAQVAKAEALCSDDDELRALAKELRPARPQPVGN